MPGPGQPGLVQQRHHVQLDLHRLAGRPAPVPWVRRRQRLFRQGWGPQRGRRDQQLHLQNLEVIVLDTEPHASLAQLFLEGFHELDESQ